MLIADNLQPLAIAYSGYLLIITAMPQAYAATPSTPAGTAAEEATELREIEVTAEPESITRIAPIESKTTLNMKEIERQQASSVFDLVRDIPGISVNGGPRASGMKFNIRGFSDNEDVQMRIDGAVKGFEKYRFGSGVFIDPDLLQRLEVTRGPSLLNGSGAIGGSVYATTKTAADLLMPGERIGARVRYGMNNNDDEKSPSISVYARPHERVDLLFAYSKRQTDNVTLSSGKQLDNSQTNAESELVKLTLLPRDDLTFNISQLHYTDSGLQPYDATGGVPGLFGTVIRAIDDTSRTANFSFEPAVFDWLKWRGAYSQGSTMLDDLLLPGKTPFSNAVTGKLRDHYRYQTLNGELFATADFSFLTLPHTLTIGIQGLKNERTISRVTENATINKNAYPSGFNAAQPPGSKETWGFILQDQLKLGIWTLTGGVRRDSYQVAAAGGTLDLLKKYNQASQIAFSRVLPSGSIALQPFANGPILAFNYAETFRPPLIDEYFTNGGFSRCIAANLGALTPASHICGDLYRPQESVNRELVLSYQAMKPLMLPGQLSSKAVLYQVDVTHTLNSLQNVNGVVDQPGTQKRHGIELELAYSSANWYANFACDFIKGRNFDGKTTQDLYDAPGNSITLTLGKTMLDGKLDIGYHLKNVDARNVVTAVVAGKNVIGVQSGYTLNDLFATWRPHQRVQLTLGIDNLLNARYFLNDGFGGAIGTEAPGRAVKAALSLTL